MEPHSGRLMEKVSPDGYVITVEVEEGDFPNHRHRWNVYSIIADSYMDLIAGIDSIQTPDDLRFGRGKSGSGSGLPWKYKGKWETVLHSSFSRSDS